MSILTKEERADLREATDFNMRHSPDGCDYDWRFHTEDMARALDTIDALEAERDALKTDLHLWQKTSSSLHAQEDWMAGMIGRIKSIAKTNQNTHTIAWSPAALREILAVIEGGKSDDSIRRVTCKCINGGETTINWRNGCGETLCHAELIDDEGGDQRKH